VLNPKPVVSVFNCTELPDPGSSEKVPCHRRHADIHLLVKCCLFDHPSSRCFALEQQSSVHMKLGTAILSRRLLSLRMRSGVAIARTRLRQRNRQTSELVVNHLAKCGGSFLKDVVRSSAPMTKIEDEKFMVTNDDQTNGDFIVGLIRNPLDFYISLWSFTSEPGTCCFKNSLTADQQRRLLSTRDVHGDTREDRHRFRKWLEEVNHDDIGLMSLRFYGSYLDPGKEELLIGEDWQHMTARNFFHLEHPTWRTNVHAALAHFNRDFGSVDCWIHTENIVNDTRRCLHLAEQALGERAPVNWTTVEEQMANASTNAIAHAPCSEFYDDNLLKFVYHRDKHIFRAFGYEPACSK